MKYLRKILIILFSIFIQICSLNASQNYQPTDRNIGVVLGTVVNVRNKPNIQGNIVTAVRSGEYVKIISWENKRVKIGRFTDKWVKIRTNNGKTGYMFVAFIFEIKALYKRWGYTTTYARYLKTVITFNKDKTYKGYLIWGLGHLKKKSFSGGYIIKGKTIILSFNPYSYLNPKTRVKTHKLYFFRHKGKNVLVDHVININERLFLGHYKPF